MKIRVSGLSGRENEDNLNCDEAISSYNQVYADPLLSRHLQDEESNSLEQRVDALVEESLYLTVIECRIHMNMSSLC